MPRYDLLRAYSAIARREQRERIKKGLAVVKAAKKAGLPVKGARGSIINGLIRKFPTRSGREYFVIEQGKLSPFAGNCTARF